MQRKVLEDMGLSKEQIDTIMAENGKDITREQGVANTYKTQLDDVEKKLKDFDGVDVKDLQGKIQTLTGELNTIKSTYESQIEGMKFQSTLEAKINSSGARNAKAVMAMLDMDSLKASKNQDSDIALALEKVKEDNDYLFQSSKPTPKIVTGTQTTQVDNSDKKAAANEAFRSLFKSE